MKTFINTIFFLLIFFSVNSKVNGQALFSLEPDYHYITPVLDTLDQFDKFWAYSFFEVESEDTLYVKWKITGKENCPEGWRYTVYDTHNCYMSEWLTSNIDPSHNLNVPMPLGSDYPVKVFNLAVSPYGVTGCCQLKVEFSLVEVPDSIIEIATYDFAIFDSTCFTVPSFGVVEQEQVLVYPNPANRAFQVLTDEVVTAATLYDLTGNLLFKLDYMPQHLIETDSLPSGLYLLQLRLQNGKTHWQRIVVQH
jgi:Secretion system C-terminal sorting domain